MFKKYELIGAGVSVVCMAAALYLIQVNTNVASLQGSTQLAGLPESGVVIVGDGENVTKELRDALYSAVDAGGNLRDMVIEDVTVGEGEAVKAGDTVSVHYIGTLPDGTEFDNSKKKGQPFQFTVGAGRVIKGWDQGLVGMKVGGQRILVIPPQLAYGSQQAGPIPPNSTLVFSIELLQIK